MLSYFVPSPELADHISFIYVVEADDAGYDQQLGALLGQFQVHVRGKLSYHFAAGGRGCSPRAMLSGPSHGSLRLRASAGMTIVGAGLLPLGWSRLARVGAEELVDQVIDARSLWGPAVDRLENQVGEARDNAGRAATLDRFLCTLLARSRDPDPRIIAIDRWIGRAPHARVDDLVLLLDVSSRQLRRLTSASHGGSPKLLASKYRTLRAATLLATGQARHWLDVSDGFADQAHLIRNFQRFVGHAPQAFTREDAFSSRRALIARWQVGTRSPLALWS